MSQDTPSAVSLVATGKKFAIVAARFNERIVDRLVEGAVDCLACHGVEAADVRVVRVPGAWEIPLALDELAHAGGVDGLIALGAVIRGGTPHFDYVCSGCANGIAGVSERHRIPVGFGVLTCDNSEQAEERAGGKAGNKGWDAALAALEMADLIVRLRP
ncbi:MAG TPA: 6,7-dimethyl-8-ribityllumazine synthase [Thermoanaerobaculia bacterium]|jgi:6,7-dimethyl-8-ribityllumazine synthase|nr:6,7-dimethyl-8-ribityllumazine synthase [Thermoanaerobaculia bacterium]